MNKRLLELRKILGLNQTEFGSRIGLTQQAVAFLETGRTPISEKHIKPICAIYHVSETWLKTGEGGMFLDEDEEEYMLETYRQLNEESKKYLLKFARSLIDEDNST